LSPLIFCLLTLPISDTGLLMSPDVTEDAAVHGFFQLLLHMFHALLLSACLLRIAVILWRILNSFWIFSLIFWNTFKGFSSSFKSYNSYIIILISS
jgi:hypothetical protein